MVNEHTAWFERFRTTKSYKLLQKKPLAYFSIEFALTDKLPTYAGGLGILAGDFIKELADQRIPAVAVGLYYQSKYGFDPRHEKDAEHIVPTPENQGLVPVVDKNNNPIRIKVPIQDQEVLVKAWKWQHDSVPLFLLDTNLEENSHESRAICHKLYDADKEVRLKQEIVLGVGGYRLLEALSIQPSIYHMNEGHSALLQLEVIRHEMKKHAIGFQEAAKMASHHIVFTNHTLVPAGNDIFSNELISFMLNKYASEMEIPLATITELGTVEDSHDFYLADFAMRIAGKSNGVSKLHVQEAGKVWAKYTLESVTNGIHIPSWEMPGDHATHKKALLQYIAHETGQVWGEDELLIGWARRMVRYKRPLALFSDLQRFVALAKNHERPIRVVMAGIAHQADDDGRAMITQLQEMLMKELYGSVVYLTDYNKALARLLVSGADIWLNTPVVGSEACGTSGMKAGLNNVLALTTKDGWYAEVDVNKFGWTFASDTIQTSLLDTLEKQVIPAYYGQDKKVWTELQKNGRDLVLNQFSATRMLRDYFEKTYLPIIDSSYEHYGI